MAEPKHATPETNQPAPLVSPARTIDPMYAREIRQLVVPPIIGAVIGSILYVTIAVQQGAWQLAMGAVGLAIAVALAVLAYHLAKRGHENAVGWLLMGAVGIAYGSPELFWSGVTLYLMAGGAVLIILTATVAVRRAQTIRATAAIIIFLVLLALANVLQPFPRYDVQHTTVLYAFVVIVTAALTLAIIVQLLRAFRLGSIRTKLIIAFLAVALVPVGLQAGRNYLLDQQISIQNANQRLLAGATQLAATIDNFIYSNLDAISNEARFPSFATYLSLPTDVTGRPTDAAQRADMNLLLANLKDKQIRALSILERPQLYILVYSLARQDGQIVASTGPNVGQSIADQIYFKETLNKGTAYASEVLFTPETPLGSLYFVAPVKNASGNILGVLVARYNSALLQQLVAASVGNTADKSFALLLDDNHLRLAHSTAPSLLYTTVAPVTEARVAELQAIGRLPFKSGEELSTDLTEFDEALSANLAEPFFTTEVGESNEQLEVTNNPDQAAIAKLKSQPWQVVYAQPQAVFLSPITATLQISLVIALVIAVLVLIAAIGMARLLADPIVSLTTVARSVAAGDLSAQATVTSTDEIGQLGQSFNSMTEQLRSMIGSLEDRVTTRTEELRASADVGRAAASNLQVDELLSQVVNLIVERFGLYYAAAFITDETGRTAVLREATGEAGRTLKSQHHQLEVGGQSMVGQAIAQRQAHIALDVGTEAKRFANPLLPDTRSEIALPLIVGDRVLGALDAQSTQPAAFDEASAAVLQSMVDQIAVALSNAEQFQQTSTALRRAETLAESIRALVDADNFQEVSQYLARYATELVAAHRTAVYIVDHDLKQVSVHAAYGDMDNQGEITYEVLKSGISGLVFQTGQPVLSVSAGDGIEPEETRERRRQNGTGALIVVPLIVQGQVIGTVTVSNLIEQRVFTQQDVDLLMTLAAQSVSMIEKLRLFEQAQRALSDLDVVNRRLTGEAWGDFAQRRSLGNVRWVGTTDRAQQTDQPEVAEAMSGGQIVARPLTGGEQIGVAVPIKLRDVPIGAVRLVLPQQAWNDDLRTALQSIAGHVAQAAETARLLDQTERDAQREKAISGAADKIHRAVNMDAVLQIAIAEINRITGLAGVSIQLGFGESAAEGNGNGATN